MLAVARSFLALKLHKSFEQSLRFVGDDPGLSSRAWSIASYGLRNKDQKKDADHCENADHRGKASGKDKQ
jgi:hypothetical protein